MSSYRTSFIIVMFLLIVLIKQRDEKYKAAAILSRRKNHKKEISEMRELAQKFVGKDCLIYTVTGLGPKGVITEITENGLLLDCDGNVQAVNLEYVTCIREWPKNAKGKKKIIFE